MPSVYPYLKFLHVAAAFVFFGNLLVTAVWKALADASRDPVVVAFAQRAAVRADRWFTLWGGVVTLLTGIVMAFMIDPHWWRITWLADGFGLFLAALTLWALVLAPVQARQARMARLWGAGPIPDAYWRLSRTWFTAAVLAIGLPLASLFFMVVRQG